MQDTDELAAVLYTRDYVKLGVLPVLGGKAILRRNEVSTFSLDIDGNHDGWKRFRKGHRVVLLDRGEQILAGPISSRSREHSAGIRDVTLAGESDMVWLAHRLTYPNPGQDPQGQTEGYWKRTAPAETVIRELVHANVGQGARSERRTSLHVSPDGGGGSTVVANLRFKNVMEEAHALALTGGVTFETVQEGDRTVFRFVEQRDFRRHIRLGEANGTLESWDRTETAPEVTNVIVAGQGEGEARTIRNIAGNQSQWNVRVEEFKDQRQTDDLDELNQAGRERLDEGVESDAVNITLNDTDARRFGRDFRLGDRVTVDLEDGTIQDLVQSAEIDFTPQGRTVKLHVGPTLDEPGKPLWVDETRRNRREIRALQTR